MSERAPINRVQPDFLDKNDFIPVEYQAMTASGQRPEALSTNLLAREPVFYTQTTMISKPTTTGFTGLTSYSESTSIRWEVTENYLVARTAFEFVRNAPHGSSGIGQNPRTGEVVAVFRIDSHFDIRREYNSTTGEEVNVVTENSSDRPWYMRRFMRVDWSQNLISGYNSVLAYDEWTGRVNAEPVPVFVNNPQDPNAPTFAYTPSADGSGRTLDYFDVVNRAVLHPETSNWGPEYPNVPVCIFGEGQTSCAPAEVAFRVSFRRADPNRDYEPASLTLPLPGATNAPHYLDMERFGFFDQMRVGYDPQQHATLDTERVHFASRHNMWVHHHALAFGMNSTTGCNSDNDCSGGAVCHIGNAPADDTHRGMCAPLAVHHLDTDANTSCQVDDDCRTPLDGGPGMSRTAVCDTQSHTCGEHMIRCTTDEYCTANVDPESSCDRAIGYVRGDNTGLCLMPFRQRQLRQIAYHESPNYPDYMQAVTNTIVHEWNAAFVNAVTASRRRECEHENGIDGSSMPLASNPCNDASVTGLNPSLGADAQFVYVGCHSPVWGTAAGAGQHTQDEVDAAHAEGWDLASCGPQGTNARLGDLRYSMIGAITDHDAQGYWGLANIASDPETGEMIAGRGAVWQTITDYYASATVDLVRVLNGELTPDDIATGNNLVEAMHQIGNGNSGHSPSSETLDAPCASRTRSIASRWSTRASRRSACRTRAGSAPT